MRTALSLLFTQLITCLISASCWGISWERTYDGRGGGIAFSVQQTRDGGFIVAGGTDSPSGHNVMWLLKLDPAGNVKWQKTYANGEAYAACVQQTRDGGFIVAGATFSLETSDQDLWVLKLDGAGNVKWQKTYGGSRMEWPRSVQQTRDGGYIMAGTTQSFGAGEEDIWLLKLDTAGNVKWQKTYGGKWEDAMESGSSVQQTWDGGYIVAGFTVHGDTANGAAWVLKLDAAGSVIWQRTYGVSRDASSVRQTRDGGYIVAGGIGPSEGHDDIWLLKLDATGNVIWQKSYDGKNEDHATSVQQTRDGGYIVAGQIDALGANDIWLLKLDAAGNIKWQKSYGGKLYDEVRSAQQTRDGGYIVAGFASFVEIANGDMWLLKLDAEGNVDRCSFSIKETAATVKEPRFIVKNTSVKPSASTAVPQLTSAVPVSTSVRAACQCGPRVSKITPAAGQVESVVTLDGSGFGSQRGQSSVIFGLVAATSILSWSNTRIQVQVPQTALTAPVAAIVNDTVGAPLEFIVTPTPPATLLPASGPHSGGTRVAILAPSAISGGQLNVLFGSTSATNLRFVAPNVIACTSPPGAGSVDVSVVSSSATTKVGVFTYR